MKLFISKYKNMDTSIHKVCLNGFKFCLVLSLISALILSTYITIHNPTLFYLGISLFKSTLFFFVFFIICAIAVDTIRKE